MTPNTLPNLVKYVDKPNNSMARLKARFFKEYWVKEHLKVVGRTREVSGLRMAQKLRLLDEEYFKDYVEEYFFKYAYHFGTSKKLYDFASESWVDRDSEEGLELQRFHYQATFKSFYDANISKYYKRKSIVFKDKRTTLKERLKRNRATA